MGLIIKKRYSLKYNYFILILYLLAVQSCEMFEAHPYDGNVKGDTNINEANIKLIEESCKGKTTIRFAFLSDTQYWFDDVDDFVNAINKRNDIDFVIHGGDVTEYSLTNEYIWIRDIMNGLRVPYVVLLGNHDCLATGKDVFGRIFGRENFAFLAGDTKFICLNTNSLEFDYTGDVPNIDFMVNQMNDNRSEYKKTIVAMHASPMSEQFDKEYIAQFQDLIRNYKGVQFCLNGHNHGLFVSDLFNDGILYYSVSSIDKRRFQLFTLKPDNSYDYEIISF